MANWRICRILGRNHLRFVSFKPRLRVNFSHSLPSPIQINGDRMKGFGGGAITVLSVNVWIFELSRKMCSSLFTIYLQLMQCTSLSLYSVERPHNMFIYKRLGSHYFRLNYFGHSSNTRFGSAGRGKYLFTCAH